MTYLRTALSLTAALTLSVSVLTPAHAQEGSGLRGTLSFSQGIELNDNPDLSVNPEGTSVVTQTNLGFNISSQTRTETLRLNLNGRLEGELAGDNKIDTFEIEDLRTDFRYRRESARSALTFTARHSETELEDEALTIGEDFFGISFGPDAIIIDGGSVDVDSASARFETGLGGPIELDLSGRYTNRDYIDTVDPDLLDTESVRLDAIARFRLNPAMAVTALAGQETIEETGGSDTETTYVGLGVETETRAMTVSGDLFLDKATTDGVTEDGLGFSVGVSRPQTDGLLGLNVESRIDDAGRRTTASVLRSFDLPTGGLTFSVGVTDQDGEGGPRVIGSIDYTRETPRGGFVASLTQAPTTTSGTAYMDTQLALEYSEEIDSTSGWSAGISYAASNELGGNDDDTLASASLTYQRALTEDWGMRTGVEVTRLDSRSSDRARNSVFFNIERDITFGF